MGAIIPFFAGNEQRNKGHGLCYSLCVASTDEIGGRSSSSRPPHSTNSAAVTESESGIVAQWPSLTLSLLHGKHGVSAYVVVSAFLFLVKTADQLPRADESSPYTYIYMVWKGVGGFSAKNRHKIVKLWKCDFFHLKFFDWILWIYSCPLCLSKIYEFAWKYKSLNRIIL